MMESSCWKSCRKDLQCTNFGLNHFRVVDFVRSQWQSSSKSIYYLGYRWLVAAFFVGCVAMSMTPLWSWKGVGFYFIFLTDWGILACLFTAMYGAVLVTLWTFHTKYSDSFKRDAALMPTSLKVFWVFHHTTTIFSFSISFSYWALFRTVEPIDPINVLTHICNCIVMLLDAFIVAHPFRLYHFYQTFVMAIIYQLFTVIYYFAGGEDPFGHKYIYHSMDWSQPKAALANFSISFPIYIMCEIVLFAVYKLRVFIHGFWSRNSIELQRWNQHESKIPNAI